MLNMTDAECLAFARAYDAEQSHQMGEPCLDDGHTYTETEMADLITCVREGLRAVDQIRRAAVIMTRNLDLELDSTGLKFTAKSVPL